MPEDSATEVTSAPELVSTSEAEQMYLITVAREAETGNEGPVRVAHIAESLGVSVPSANEMVRKLDSRGLLAYEPYHGVLLSEQGHRIADQVLRTRRLWATFLADHLGFSPADADDQACHLEHATSPEAADRLAAFLGNPESGPLGRPIPESAASSRRQSHMSLRQAPIGEVVEILAITAPDPMVSFLAAEGLVPGGAVTPIASGNLGVLVTVSDGHVHLVADLAAQVAVRRTGGRA